jgi:hypothetical protein
MVGFDIRLNKQHLPAGYLEKLYRRDIAAVYSVDFSFFERHRAVKEYDWEEVGKTKTAEGLYYSCDEAKKLLAKMPIKERENYLVVGLTVENDWLEIVRNYPESTREQDYLKRAREGIKPPSTLKLLGFDVASAMYEWVSALSNCIVDDRSFPENLLNNQLSEHHLIKDFSIAIQFRDWANKRLNSHAPFLVWGLFHCS